jgi:DNA-binding PadR family transcriptional regulator
MLWKRKPSQPQQAPPADRALVSSREADILEILIPGEKYGLEIADRVGERRGKEMPIGSLYTTMDRMQAKGLVESRLGDPHPDRGGNRRRFYRVTGIGRRALDAYIEVQRDAALRNAGGIAHA